VEPVAQTLTHVGAALVAGALIGLERTRHGRAAGFRTHALVCLASSILMRLPFWLGQQVDGIRMAQGIMTGIGFLGAGAIVREGITVMGLTTAASIWVTASIGILFGAGMWTTGSLATVAALGVLSLLQTVERALPVYHLAEFRIAYARAAAPERTELQAFLREEGLGLDSLSFRLTREGTWLEYAGRASALDEGRFAALSRRLATRAEVVEFSIEPY
jgi:putative Mg2+ transporter-C (MgtC) family protein